MANSSSLPVDKNFDQSRLQNSTGLSPSRSKPVQDVIDGRTSTPPDTKLYDYDQDSEVLSKSLPSYTENMSLKPPPQTSTRKISEQYPSARSRSPMQRKISQNANTDRGTTKSSESTPQQTKLSTSLPRSPTPKMFFNNLINRLSGRMPGNSPSSSIDSRTSSSSDSRPVTPSCGVIEPNATLSFRLTADEFSSCDHKLKLYFEVSLFRWGSSERFCCLLKVRCFCFCLCLFTRLRTIFIECH